LGKALKIGFKLLIHPKRNDTYSSMEYTSMRNLKIIYGRNSKRKAGNSRSPMAKRTGRKKTIRDVSPGDNKWTYRNQ
jgi:hypothetical protein